MSELQEQVPMAGGPGAGKMLDPKTQQALSTAKQALATPGKMNPQIKKNLSSAKDQLSDVKADKDREEVSQLVGELDPTYKRPQAPGTPQMMMKRRMKKK